VSARGHLIKRLLIVLAILIACGVAVSRTGVLSADPYPAFMADYEGSRPRSYEEAQRAFSDFVVRAFPVGSDGGDAISQINGGGFKAGKSTPESSEFGWERHAGPCSELYSIIMRTDADRRISSISGQLQSFCF
jgi:hypothetical protein